MHRFLSIVWWLSVCSVCSVGTLRSQPANVQADPTTGVLFRPSAATFISGNNLATATGGIVLGANGGTGVANTGKTITLGGNLTTSGAFGLTLTLSGTTNVTLPTSGQLATLSGGEILTNKTLTSPTLTTPILGAATATSLTLSGNISSAAWTTNGVRLKGVAATFTDTTSTGTVAAAYTDVLGGNTIAASNATTFTDYITAYFREPTAGSLVTMTNKWALGSESLRVGTSTPMTVSTAGAITANSLTGQTATNLTLTGGSTGASLVLGQGATAGAVSALPTGTGALLVNTSTATNHIRQSQKLAVAVAAAYGGISNTSYNSLGSDVGPIFDFQRSTGATIGTMTAVSSGDTLGFLVWRGSDGAAFQDAAFIKGQADGTVSSGVMPGRLIFSTSAAGSSAPTEAMRLTATRNLLIGGTTDIPGTGGLKVFGTTAALNTASGALQVAGGVGVAGALYVGASSRAATGFTDLAGTTGLLFNTTTNQFYSGGSLIASVAAGGVSVATSTASTGVGTGALQVAGGIYAGAASVFGGAVTLSAGTLTATNTAATQGIFKGWNSRSGANAQNGQIEIGSVTGLRLMSDASGTGGSVIDDRWDNASSSIQFRLRGDGTPVTALTLTGTAAATLFGAVTVGRDNSGAADSSVTITAPSDNADLFFRALTTSTKRSRLRFFNSLGDEQARIQSGGEVANPRGNLVLSTSGASGLTTALTIDSTQAATFAGKVTVSSTTAGSAGAGALVVSGGLATGAASYLGGDVTMAGAAITSSATLSGAGAIPITTSLVKFTSTGAANALTLANGVDGQRLTIVHDVKGTLGTGVLTPTTKTGFSTITFTNAGDTVSLVYVTTRGWMVTGSYLATIAP